MGRSKIHRKLGSKREERDLCAFVRFYGPIGTQREYEKYNEFS